tara:strand:+ start:354 stop:659 length:306 start_codon:yes stop_codon:yes gene_type:complete
MSDMTFTVKDLIVAASVLGPVIVSALGIYNKMRHQDAKLCAMVDSLSAQLNVLSTRMDDLDDKLITESRDIRNRVTEGHNRLNPVESRLGQLEGWKDAMKK